MWVASIFACANGEKIAKSPAKNTHFYLEILSKMQLKRSILICDSLKSTLDLIPCDNFDLQQDLGSLENLANRIYLQNQQKNMKEEQFCIHNVNRNWILFYFLISEYV